MTPDCFMASTDLKDAYYSVSVNESHRKYPRFIWKNHLFQLPCIPNGLNSAPRIFTKILSPVYVTLRSQGKEKLGCIDDSYLQGGTLKDFETNFSLTTKLFRDLGLILNQGKSIFQQTQIITWILSPWLLPWHPIKVQNWCQKPKAVTLNWNKGSLWSLVSHGSPSVTGIHWRSFFTEENRPTTLIILRFWPFLTQNFLCYAERHSNQGNDWQYYSYFLH